VSALAEDIPVSEKPCKRCNDVRPVAEFSRSASSDDGYANVCKACRTPAVITDPTDIDVLSFRSFDFALPPDVKHRIRAGGNYRVTLALHVEHAEQRPAKEARWVSRWLEVLAVD
jgi:hypothetical protein